MICRHKILLMTLLSPRPTAMYGATELCFDAATGWQRGQSTPSNLAPYLRDADRGFLYKL